MVPADFFLSVNFLLGLGVRVGGTRLYIVGLIKYVSWRT